MVSALDKGPKFKSLSGSFFYKANRLFIKKTKKMKFVIKKQKRKKESNLLMALVGFELPTSHMYNKLAAFTNTAGSKTF